MARVAVWTNTPLREVTELSEPELDALLEAVEEKQRIDSWSTSTELQATTLDAVARVLTHLSRGIAVYPVSQLDDAEYPPPTPRPEWMGAPEAQAADDAASPAESDVSLDDLARMFMGFT